MNFMYDIPTTITAFLLFFLDPQLTFNEICTAEFHLFDHKSDIDFDVKNGLRNISGVFHPWRLWKNPPVLKPADSQKKTVTGAFYNDKAKVERERAKSKLAIVSIRRKIKITKLKQNLFVCLELTCQDVIVYYMRRFQQIPWKMIFVQNNIWWEWFEIICKHIGYQDGIKRVMPN